jgi:Electron transfer DM13
MTHVSRRTAFTALAGVAVVLAAAAALYFEPWKLVVNETVQEAPPVAAAPQVAAPQAAVPPVAGPEVAAPAPAVVARGELVAHEHASSGSVQVIRLADGTRVLRLDDLRTSNGPRLVVRLSAAPVLPGRDGWFVFGDDAAHVDLGPLKGNIGSSNYPIPADVDLAALPSVSIWCERFDVSFAAAALR